MRRVAAGRPDAQDEQELEVLWKTASTGTGKRFSVGGCTGPGQSSLSGTETLCPETTGRGELCKMWNLCLSVPCPGPFLEKRPIRLIRRNVSPVCAVFPYVPHHARFLNEEMVAGLTYTYIYLFREKRKSAFSLKKLEKTLAILKKRGIINEHLKNGVRYRGVEQLVARRLITRRSLVQVQPPQPLKSLNT